MDNTSIKTAPYALRYGLIYGIILVVFAIMLYTMDMHYQNSTLSTVVNILIGVGGILWGMLAYKKDNGGFISLSQSLKVGVAVALVGSLVGIIYGVVLTEFIDPTTMDKALEFQKQQMLSQNPEMSVEQANQFVDMQKKFSSPLIRSAFGLLFGIFFGFIVALISGLVIKKNRPE
ncbi:MAG: DUF4199 domain-containing protein [Flavobacteriales bacterium]|jgi:tetrahydromethanopterin S-methyltransferase subunit G